MLKEENDAQTTKAAGFANSKPLGLEGNEKAQTAFH